MKGFLLRTRRSDHGTEGALVIGGFYCYTLELPWRDNRPNISCIPEGTYRARLRRSPKFGVVYWVLEVEGRTYILVHSGNWAGDRALGLITDTYGCILLGMSRGWLRGQRAVLNSRYALRKFMETTKGKEIELTIKEVM